MSSRGALTTGGAGVIGSTLAGGLLGNSLEVGGLERFRDWLIPARACLGR